MFGSLRRRTTNDVIWRMYEMTAANTAMFSSAATTLAPRVVVPSFQTMIATTYPTIAPAIKATCGVFRSPCVFERNFGK